MQLTRLIALSAILAGTAYTSAQTAPLTLSVDLTDAPRKILHSVETIPVQPGPLTLVYPEWIPGEHGPTGPLINSAGFFITTPTGEPVKWERDLVDMYSYHITVPAGVTQLNIKMDFLATTGANFTAGGSTSANLALLSWNTLLVYPLGGAQPGDIAHTDVSKIMVTPSIKIPAGWKFGTALDPASSPTSFKTVSLEQLIDSPVLAGRWFRQIDLAPEVTQSITSTSLATAPRTSSSPRTTSTSSLNSSGRLAPSTSRATTAATTSSSRSPTRLRTSVSSTTSPPMIAYPKKPSSTTHPSSRKACSCPTSSPTAGTASIAAPPASLRRTTRSP